MEEDDKKREEENEEDREVMEIQKEIARELTFRPGPAGPFALDPFSPESAKAARDFALAKSKGSVKQINDIRRHVKRMARKWKE